MFIYIYIIYSYYIYINIFIHIIYNHAYISVAFIVYINPTCVKLQGESSHIHFFVFALRTKSFITYSSCNSIIAADNCTEIL